MRLSGDVPTLGCTWKPTHVGDSSGPAAFHGRRSTDHEVRAMKWDIPQAVDMRFGFEITMYISNR